MHVPFPTEIARRTNREKGADFRLAPSPEYRFSRHFRKNRGFPYPRPIRRNAGRGREFGPDPYGRSTIRAAAEGGPTDPN